MDECTGELDGRTEPGNDSDMNVADLEGLKECTADPLATETGAQDASTVTVTVGTEKGTDTIEGISDGGAVGTSVGGTLEGTSVGTSVGGTLEGTSVGGTLEGTSVGTSVGGTLEGTSVGGTLEGVTIVPEGKPEEGAKEGISNEDPDTIVLRSIHTN